MRLKPLHDWAVIVPSEAEVRTAGGIFIPDMAKEKPAEGVVEAVGPGAYEEEDKFGRKKKKEPKERKFIPTTVKPGERVLYAEYAGQKITLGNEERVLVRERDILGILPPKPAAPRQELPPLQIPAVTYSSRETAIAKRPAQTAVTAVKPKAEKPAKKAAARPAAKKAKKKATKKAVKKAAKKKGGKKK